MPQSRASMLVARAVDPQPGERVLDLCAAPGGKTTHLAALMGDEGEVVAVELDPKRAATMRRNAERLGASCVEVVVGDAAEPAFGAGFDRVLVDPPCSDLGTLQLAARMRAGARRPEQVAELAALQARILDAAVQALKPGGTLVYSTCTISPDENERQMDALVPRRPRPRRARRGRSFRLCLTATARTASSSPTFEKTWTTHRAAGSRRRAQRARVRARTGSARAAASRGCVRRSSRAATAASTACVASS